MIRLKDFTALLSRGENDIWIFAFDSNGNEVDYNEPEKYMDLLIKHVTINKRNLTEYSYIISLDDKVGYAIADRGIFTYNDLVKIIKSPNVIIKPMDFVAGVSYGKWDSDISAINNKNLENKLVAEVLPIFYDKYTLLQVYLISQKDFIANPAVPLQ